MPGKTNKRRRKHRGSQTGTVKRTRSRPRNRQEAMARAKTGGGKRKATARPDRRDIKPTWNSAAKRGALFALLLLPISLLFGQTVSSAIILTIIAAVFYVPLGFYTETFFYDRRRARLAKQRAEARAEKDRDEGGA